MTIDEKLDRIIVLLEAIAYEKLPQHQWSAERSQAESESQRHEEEYAKLEYLQGGRL